MIEVNQNHNVLINYWTFCKDDQAKEGELALHKNQVSEMFYYEREFTGDGRERYIKIVLPRQMILDLAEDIRRIESQESMKILGHDLPF